MCGLSGVFSLSGEDVNRLDVERMNARIAHRGPDGEGLWVSQDHRCALGHRRLAIIDTDARANQPMLTPDGRYAIAFNGEIYNFLEVRRDLEARGHSFRTQSDTEVILSAWREWGADMQLRFNGMWAIAIYDSEEKSLFLTRDRFAEKPLYYIEKKGLFAFASEMQALVALPWAGAELDLDVIARGCFDTHTIEASERTLYKQIVRLPAGHSLTLNGERRTLRRWWRTVDHLVDVTGSRQEIAEEFWERFRDAVKICMRSDVPIGTCLSGGFDSSAIVATMGHLDKNIGAMAHERQADDWRHAFVATFPGMSNDETPEAKLAADYAGIKNPNLIDMTRDGPTDFLEEGMAAIEGISLSVPTAAWRTYQAVRAGGVMVSIDGHGADEMMGGYRQSGQGMRFWFRNLLGNASGRHAGFNLLSDHLKLRVMRTQGHLFLRNQSTPPPLFDIAAHSDQLPKEWGALNKRLYGMVHATVLPTLMRNFDRMSMAHGVEVRSPFLDWRLVTFAFSLPEALKSDAEYSKLIAREAMRGRMPEAIRSSKIKKGFSSQMPEWLNGDLGRWAAARFLQPNLAFDSIVDTRALLERVDALNRSSGWTWEIASRIWPYVHAKWFCDKYS
jgi:asparagine synthase (glutamine-hydrolysing)